MQNQNQRTIDLRTLVAYGSLGFPIAILGYPMTLFLHPYYAGELGLGLAAISTVLLLSRLTDFITDPLMGWISDRTQTRFGRRRPFLVLGLPVMLLGIYKLFMPEPPVDIWYMLIWNMVVYLGWTIAGLFGASIVIWFFQEVLDSPGSGEVLAGIGMTLLFVFPIAVAVVLWLL